MRLLLLAGLLALSANAAWQRHVMTPKDEWVDTPDAHPLSYFTDYPALRCEECDYVDCTACSSGEMLALAKKVKVKIDLRRVGKIGAYEVYDLYYQFGSERRNSTKLILVRTGADQYREIYQCSPTTLFGTGAAPSVFIRSGNDQFLEAKYDASGGRTNAFGQKAADFYDYFWFDKTGANLVDFRPILFAAKSVSPTEAPLPWAKDLAAPGVNWLWYFTLPLQSLIGVSDGTAIVDFKFNHGRVVVTKVLFKPDSAAKY